MNFARRFAVAPVVLLLLAAPIYAASKIHPSARRTPDDVFVYFRQGVSAEDARRAIRAAGGEVSDSIVARFRFGRLHARLGSASLDVLVQDDRVTGVIARSRLKIRADNAASAALSHVTELYTAPYNLDGSGVVLSLFELAAAQGTHPEFGGRLTVHTTGGTASDKSHATHTSGTIGAAGLDPSAKGMAPASTIHQFSVFDNDGDWADAKATNLPPLGVVADSNSWGYLIGWTNDGSGPLWVGDFYGDYDLTLTAPIDIISRDTNILFVHSAGNDGTNQPTLNAAGEHRHDADAHVWCYSQNGSGNDCAPPCSAGLPYCETEHHLPFFPYRTMGITASAKNVVAVGAVNTGKEIASFSSRGPTKDGRIKPDVVARGVSVYSTVPTDAYGNKSGTSMSTPVVAGIVGLLTQQWKLVHAGANPLPATLKALLIAGAEDLGNAGPDYVYGFGFVNAQTSADLIRTDNATGARVRIDSVTQGQTYERVVSISSTQTLRVVLVWSDPGIPYTGGPITADPALVNDLDLTVIGPGGTALPYVLDKNNPANVATHGINTIDNVEMIEIPNALAGTYRVLVNGTDVPQGPQQFAMVANAPIFDPVVLTATGTTTPSVALTWTQPIAGATYDVYVRSGASFQLRTAGLATTSFNDTSVNPNAAYLYRIDAHVPGGGVVQSNIDLAVTTPLDSIVPGAVILHQHIDNIATGVNAARTLAGLSNFTWTVAPQVGGLVRVSQITDLRTALNEARTALSLSSVSFPALSVGATIRATDFTALQDALR